METQYLLIVTVAALTVYFLSILIVGYVRTKYKIDPPATTGPDGFNRGFRVHQNTMEQLVLFLPAMWLYGWYQSPDWAAIIGAVWVLARLAYIFCYLSAASRRLLPFIVSVAASVILLIGGIAGAVQSLLA